MGALVLRNLDRMLWQLPPLPQAASHQLELHAAGERNPDAYARVFRQDSGLSAAVVRLANCPAVGPGHPVHSIREACFSLGPDTLLNLVVSCAVLRQFPVTGDQSPGFDRHAFWVHGAAVAVLARAIARRSGAPPDSSFAAGLLHDVGRAVLEAHFPREFGAVLRYRDRHDVWIRDAELAVIGFDHCVIGERVARRWQLPETILGAIAQHHQPERPGHEEPAALIVHVADILARGLEVGDPGDDTIPLLWEDALRRLGINWVDLRRCLRSAEELREVAGEVVERILPASSLSRTTDSLPL